MHFVRAKNGWRLKVEKQIGGRALGTPVVGFTFLRIVSWAFLLQAIHIASNKRQSKPRVTPEPSICIQHLYTIAMQSTSSSSTTSSSSSSSNIVDDVDTDCGVLRWYRRPDTEQWWPVLRYPSHKAVMEKFPFDQMSNQPEQQHRLAHTLIYMEGRQQQRVPAVRLLGVEPPTFWAITEDDADRLAEQDFIAFMLTHITPVGVSLPMELEGPPIDEAQRINQEMLVQQKAKMSKAKGKRVVPTSNLTNSTTSTNNSNNNSNEVAAEVTQEQESHHEDLEGKRKTDGVEPTMQPLCRSATLHAAGAACP